MPRQRTACFSCASIKSACSQGQPCQRCKRLALTCSYAFAHLRKWTDPDEGQHQYRRRVRHSRSRNGCESCVRRRKKCDEAFPKCGECRRLNISNCRVGGSKSTDDEGQGARKIVPESREATDSQLPHRNISSLDSKVNEYLGYVASLPEGDLTGITRRGHLNESSALHYRRGVQEGAQEKETTSDVVVALGGVARLKQVNIPDLDATEHHLFLHYMHHVGRALVVVSNRENPFLQEIRQMAMEVKAVRHAMLALAACHLCKVYPKFEDTLIRQHSLALYYLKLDLRAQRTTDYILATSLLLSLFGICQGNSQKWILHLYGAKALIDSHLDRPSPKPLSEFLLDLYDFICCKTRITCDKVPKLRGGYPILSSYNERPHNSIHPLFGLAGDLYQLLDSITQLALDRANPDTTPERQAMHLTRAREIEKRLQLWAVPARVKHPNDQLLQDSTMAAEAIRWAALIRLYQVMGESYSNPTKHHNAAENILAVIAQIRPGSPVDAQLLLPLFMAGLSVSRKTERLQIEYRISLLESSIGMGNIAGAHQLLDIVWEQSDEDTLDWEVLVQRGYPCVLLY
ncbi:hypothetical protein BO94DRAFT_624101 [Aspergillus sclerotioniger CBS 115572]|uniref:Zn(2)-C6 fungal-type domain-containing protein n=1 Tax=Aspergillus sclerotioniger CBS 115572 TaxID=1450535 RepID=A0A317WUN2_9EURO|nr:hypothetical protein BO94DRAFT_624101 [Aspergillus sclerotioniger CBS 115572]PWY87960.1 hypothetical protein BO94DRAFT_624101 [Aspergillus sclerotioniger CBS 115572]